MVRVAIVQFKPGKGSYTGNLARLGGILAELGRRPEPPQLVVLPETALTGYFVEGGARELAVTSGSLFADLSEQHAKSGAPPMDVAVGFYEEWRRRLYNSALYATLGGSDARIRHVHRKVFLPTYGVFDEERFVEAGREVRAFDASFGRAALLVCEDAWHSFVPTLAALGGAEVVVILAASPACGATPRRAAARRHPANVGRWERIARSVAEEHGVWAVVSHLVGFEGGKGFAGGSVVATPRGEIAVRGPLWDEAVVEARLDLAEVARARASAPLLSDFEEKLPHLLRSLDSPASPVTWDGPRDAPCGVPVLATAAAPVPVAAAPADRRAALEVDCELLERWLVEFLREEVSRRRDFSNGVLGLSGGVDSAVTAYLAAKALGPGQVTGVMMPYRTSHPDSLVHGKLVVERLGIGSRVVDITPAVDGYLQAEEPDAGPGRRGNVMARVRMTVLFDQSAKLRALPLGTGNKTERLLGYFTWHADDSPPVNPLGDLYKTQVWALARHLGVPAEIVDKPASADLIKGQTDEGDLGISYPRADAILFWLLRGYHPNDIAQLGFSAGEIQTVRRRLESTHWKRRLPTVAMVSQTAIGESYLRPVDF